MKKQLTKSQESFCENMGLFGVLLSLTCLVQHFVFLTGHWFSFVLMPVYSLPVFAYVLLMKKHHLSAILLWVSAALMLPIQIVMVQQVFSLVLVMLLGYLLVTLYLLYGMFIPGLIRQKYLAEKSEAKTWAGKI